MVGVATSYNHYVGFDERSKFKENSMTEFIRQITPPNSPPNRNDHDPTTISVHKVKVILSQALVRFFWDFWEPKNCEKLPLRCEESASQSCQSLKISRFALLRGDFLRNYSYNGGPGTPSELWALRYDLVEDFCMRKINLSGRAPARFLSNTVSIVPIFLRFFAFPN